MVAAVGMGAFVAGMFHLVTHAFFKALLFLAAGSVILGMEHGARSTAPRQRRHTASMHDFDPQDMRNMGGLREPHAGHLLGLPDRRAGPGRDRPAGRLLLEG